MDVYKEQFYEVKNLVSKSDKCSTPEFQKSLVDMVDLYKGYTVEEYIITTTKSIEIINGEQVMDVEILLPVSYRIPVEEPYVYKERLKLTNALYMKVLEVAKLQDALNEMNQYILEQRLQPITTAYLVQTKNNNQPCVEIYIGINPNIL